MAVVTTGFFDGVHLGHRHVLERLVSSARERGEEALVVTFWPHPRTVLQQDAREFRILTTLEEKKALLLSAGVDRVEVLPFTRAFAALTASEYLALLRDKFGASLVIMGYDNRIGSDRKTEEELNGTAAMGVQNPSSLRSSSLPTNNSSSESKLSPELLSVGPLPFTWPRAATGFATPTASVPPFPSSVPPCPSSVPPCPSSVPPFPSSVPPFPSPVPVGPSSVPVGPSPSFHGLSVESSPVIPSTSPVIPSTSPVIPSEAKESISSTQIRKALKAGDIEAANGMLGYRYSLYGAVVAGNRLGRTIGFPTANMQLYEPLKLVPGNGVYAVEAQVLDRTFRGMCNIGIRPTVGGTVRTIETHILDGFNEDIYGLPLRVTFLRKIRDEIRFPSLDALREQLHLDAAAALRD